MASLDIPISYHRLTKAPLDDMEVFNDLNSLMDYCDNGARYNGQRVIVLNDQLGFIEYTIINDIPIINTKGSELIFRKYNFDSDDIGDTHYLLIYENNSNEVWDKNDVFTFKNDRLCLISQLEIFRIVDVTGNKTFKFHMEIINKDRTTPTIYYTWSQDFNPYDGPSIIESLYDNINKLTFNEGNGCWLRTNRPDFYLMPKTASIAENAFNTTIRIYIKAEDYYQALI